MIEAINLQTNINDDEILEVIHQVILSHRDDGYISIDTKKRLKMEIFNSIRRLDILQELIDNREITEIMINGPDHIFVEKDGAITRWHYSFESARKLEDVIQQIVSKANRIVNEANPIVDARLGDGSRVNIVLPPVSLSGPIVTIRKFPEAPISINQLIDMGAITEQAAVFLKKLVIAKYNIFVSGGTGSGKTTFLNVLSNFIPKDERIITIEDSAELQIKEIENLVSLEVRNANVEGKNEITIRDLIKTALRMRPEGLKTKRRETKILHVAFRYPNNILLKLSS